MASNPKKSPLKVRVTKGELVISIGVDTLKVAAERCEEFWLPLTDKSSLVISAPNQFAKDVRDELRREDEVGGTPVHYLLDKIFEEVVNNGSEALDCDAMDALADAERAESSANGDV